MSWDWFWSCISDFYTLSYCYVVGSPSIWIIWLFQKNLSKMNRDIYTKNGILLPKLFWPTVSKNCSSDREKVLKFEAEGQEFATVLRSLEQFIQTLKL